MSFTKTRKTFITVGLSLLFMILAGVYCSVNAMTSHAAATFEITSHTETDPTVLNKIYNDTDATSADTIIAVDFNVSGMDDSNKINSVGFLFDYDSLHFAPLFEEDSQGNRWVYNSCPVKRVTCLGTYSTSTSQISITAIASSPVKVNGTFYTLYFTLESSTNPALNPITGFDTVKWRDTSVTPHVNPVYVEPTVVTYSVLIGDITGNGEVDTDDSVVLQQILEEYEIQQASLATVAANLALWFPNLEAAEQVDANGDGYFSQADVNSIMKYYSYAILHMGSYSGLAGTYYVFTRSI